MDSENPNPSGNGLAGNSLATEPPKRRGRPPKSQTSETTQNPQASAESAASAAEPVTTPAHVLPDEVPPPPASVLPQEAAKADSEKDLAREQRQFQRPQSPLSQGSQPKKRGRPKKDDLSGCDVIVVENKPVVYVDGRGERLPDLGPDFAKPFIKMGSGMVSAMGMDPFTDSEVDYLAESWAPIFHKYAGFVMPWSAEIVAATSLLSVMGPRVKKLDAKRKAERADANRKAAEDAARKKAMGQNPGPQIGPK